VELLTCVLCGLDIAVEANGWAEGHNPAPLSDEGRCCNNCNTLVLIARLSVSSVLGNNEVV
tara:strand:+ start:1766 stop:1948 length:183 start_codon:yes stop_codon:yes gene_type:complete